MLLAALLGVRTTVCVTAPDSDIVIHEGGPNAESLTSTADGAVIFVSMAKAEPSRPQKAPLPPGSGLSQERKAFGAFSACLPMTPPTRPPVAFATILATASRALVLIISVTKPTALLFRLPSAYHSRSGGRAAF